MDQLRHLSGLGKGDGPETGLDALCKERCGGKIGTCIRIQKEEVLAGPGRTAGVDHLDVFSDEILPELSGIVDRGRGKDELGSGSV